MCLRTCFFNSCCWGKSVYFVSCAAANMWVTKSQTFYCSLRWFLQCPAHWTEKHEVHILLLPEFHCSQVWSPLSWHIKPVLTTHSSLLTAHYSLLTPHYWLLPLHICAPLITHTWKLPNAQQSTVLMGCSPLRTVQCEHPRDSPLETVFQSCPLGFPQKLLILVLTISRVCNTQAV